MHIIRASASGLPSNPANGAWRSTTKTTLLQVQYSSLQTARTCHWAPDLAKNYSFIRRSFLPKKPNYWCHEGRRGQTDGPLLRALWEAFPTFLLGILVISRQAPMPGAVEGRGLQMPSLGCTINLMRIVKEIVVE